jgi:hypothetical protein
MHREISNFIFLTGKEVTVHGNFFLSVHLRGDSPRARRIEQLCEDDRGARLRLVLFDPVLGHPSSVMPGTWHLVPHVRFTGRSKGRSVTHTSFSYDYGGPKGHVSRRMTEDEVRYFRENNHVHI